MSDASAIETFAQAEERWKKRGLFYTSVSVGILLVIFTTRSLIAGEITTALVLLAGFPFALATMWGCRLEPMPWWLPHPILQYLLAMLVYMLINNYQQSSPLMWLFAGPAICMFCLGARFGGIISFFLMLIIIAALVYNDHILTPAYSIRFVCAFILLTAVCYAYERNREVATKLLSEAQERIDTLEGLLPICAWCKKIQNPEGDWEVMESYISHHVSVDISHGVCPDCKSEVRKSIAS